jgi:hypothetical protein
MTDKDELGLLSAVDRSTAQSLLTHTAVYTKRPDVKSQWHVCLQTPLLGQVSYSFDDLESLRRELTRSLTKLVFGKIHVYYGKALPVVSDGTGGRLFVISDDGQEIPITDGQDDRIPVNDGQFSFTPININIDEVV